MKNQLIIACLGILVVSLAGCSETRPPAVNEPLAVTSESSVAVETPVEAGRNAPARTPLPRNVRKDADGNLIKPDGWPIQEITPQETRRMTEAGKTSKGRIVLFNVLSVTPQGRPATEAISPAESYYEWRINHVRELSGRDGKVFCYVYWASLFMRNGNANSAMSTATSYRLCDYDGDGKFEFNGDGYKFTIPDWVRTLPGDPASANSNANY